MSINSRTDLLIMLENHTSQEKKVYLEGLLLNTEEEVDMALLQNNNELATWKMSVSLLIEQELESVESKIYEGNSLFA